MKLIKILAAWLIIVLLFGKIYVLAEEVFYSIEEIPEWVEGVLGFSTRGTTDITQNNIFEQYVCFLDFNTNCINALEVPSDAVVMQDTGISKKTILLNRMDNIHGYAPYGENNGFEWRQFSGRTIHSKDSNDERYFTFGYEEGFNCYDWFELEAPLSVLGFNADKNEIYYLGYGVSEAGCLEVCLKSKSGTNSCIYTKFSNEFDFTYFYYDISADGKVAWVDAFESDIIKMADGKQEYICPDKRSCAGAICWLNENEVIYCFDEKKNTDGLYHSIHLGIWNTLTNEYYPLKECSSKGFVFPPFEIAVDSLNRQVAFYYQDYLSDDIGFKIGITSLESGATCIYAPWFKKQYEYSDGKNYLDGIYGNDDEGIAFFMPDERVDAIKLKLFWYEGE